SAPPSLTSALPLPPATIGGASAVQTPASYPFASPPPTWRPAAGGAQRALHLAASRRLPSSLPTVASPWVPPPTTNARLLEDRISSEDRDRILAAARPSSRAPCRCLIGTIAQSRSAGGAPAPPAASTPKQHLAASIPILPPQQIVQE
uniref:Uncharacterized protein n=1 Tax=Leersia perrieri TaxID=77586 RepID=A0A0D9XW97_9ORYZ